jgi:hypothetical protein
MQTETLRALLLELLKAPHAQKNLQFNTCVSGAEALAAVRCPNELIRLNTASGPKIALRDEDKTRLKHVVWDLILERILIPGTESASTINDGWPFLSLTDHGRKVVAAGRPVPYDPDGYLARLETATGGIHPTVQRYLEESLSTFRTGNILASAVMLGAASEMIFLEISRAIAVTIADPNARTKFEDKTGPLKMMADRKKTVMDWLIQKKGQLPSDWQRQEQLDLVDTIATLIRQRRNDAGHPQDPPASLTHEEMYAMLLAFPHYCEKVYELMAWLAARPAGIA